MSTTITPQRVAEAFCKTLDEIDGLRAELEEKIKPMLEKQEARYNWLRENGFPMEFLVQIFVRDRERKRLLTYEIEKIIDPLQSEREQHMTAVLQAHSSGQFNAIGWGTAYPDLKEQVSVENWDAFIEGAILTPVVSVLSKTLSAAQAEGYEVSDEELAEVIKDALPLNLLNKAVSKSAVLDRMGEMEDILDDKGKKTGEKQRPFGDKIPPGVKYNAFRTVKVRKT